MDRAEVEIRSHAMTDLERKLEEIAEKFYKSDCQCDECIRELVQATTEATARYCAEIVKAVPERGWDENHPQASWMNGYVAGFDMAAETILRECGVKE